MAFVEAVRFADDAALRRVLDRAPAVIDVKIGVNTLRLDRGLLRETVRRGPPHANEFQGPALQFLVFTEEHQNLDIAATLLEYGADPDAPGYVDGNEKPFAPIAFASWEGGIDAMRLLLENGADVSGEQGQLALDFAARHHQVDRVDLLTESGAEPSPFLLVVAGLTDRLAALVDRDPSVLSLRDERGWNLLHAAGHRIFTDGVTAFEGIGRTIGDALIARGARHDVFSAAAFDDIGALRRLASDPNSRLADGTSPLQFAAVAGAARAVRFLLDAGADPSSVGDGILSAARYDDVDVVRPLLEHGVTVDDELVNAAAWRVQDAAIVALVLRHGGEPNAGSRPFQPLHWTSGHHT